MNIGEKLMNLRKEKHLSQEEVADRLNVTRQTVSKWETDQSTPDFDKIVPLCELYGITADELLTGIKKEMKIEEQKSDHNLRRIKRAKGIGIAVFLYFVSIAWIMITIPVMMMNPIVSSSIFLLICGVATYIIIYTSIVYKTPKEKEESSNPIMKRIESILALITVVIYLILSFVTMAWHITWIIWIIYALVIEIIKLIFVLREDRHEE